MQIVGICSLKSTGIILLLIALASILDSHLFLLVDWCVVVLIVVAVEVELHATVDEVLLSSLIVLDLVIVNHVPKK